MKRKGKWSVILENALKILKNNDAVKTAVYMLLYT